MPLAKEELIEFEGSVLELLPDARFRVRLEMVMKPLPIRPAE